MNVWRTFNEGDTNGEHRQKQRDKTAPTRRAGSVVLGLADHFYVPVRKRESLAFSLE
jgi:hypothetical protein